MIGGGPGGYETAAAAAARGEKVILFERDRLGGTCLNRGCIPTKCLCASAKLLDDIRHASALGISTSGTTVDFTAIKQRISEVTDTLRQDIAGALGDVEIVNAEATIGPGPSVVAAAETYTAPSIIIATGSAPAHLRIPGAETALDSDAVLALDAVPESMVIIGGGVIGLELGSVYNTFGTKVTVVEMLPEILPAMDSELTKIVKNQLTAAGMDIRTGTSVEKIEKSRKGAKVTVKGANGEEVIEVENVLVAVGRKVDPAAINASATGLTTLEANDKMETSVPGVYSIGDANGKWMLAYTAMTMGEIAAANATGGDMTFDRKSVPSVIFLGPEFAGVGLTEDEAKAKGISYKVGKFSMAGNGRSLVMGQTDGMIKVIADTKYNEILGVHMVGPRACDMIAEASLALRLECTVDEWIDTVHAHPTVTEAMREAMLAVNKQCLHGANR